MTQKNSFELDEDGSFNQGYMDMQNELAGESAEDYEFYRRERIEKALTVIELLRYNEDLIELQNVISNRLRILRKIRT